MSCTRRCITQASRRLCQDRSSTNLKLVGSSLLEHVRSYSAVAAVEIDKSPAETWVPGAETVVDRLGSIHHLLVTEFGASDIWLRRIEEAQKDLRVTRQPVLGGMSSIMDYTKCQSMVANMLVPLISSRLSFGTRWSTRSRPGYLSTIVMLTQIQRS